MGKIVLQVKSFNPTKTLNKLVENSIRVYGFSEGENNLCLITFDSHQLKLINKYFKSQSISFNIIRYQGLSSLLNSIKKAWCFLAVLLLCAIGFFVFNNRLLRVECIGNVESKEDEICKIIEDSGIVKYSKLTNDICNKLENEILSKINSISKVSIIFRGNTLIVNIKEKLSNKELSFGEFNSIVSPYDGYVESFTLIQGTSSLKIGDLVKKGDVLVFPYVFSSSNEKQPIFPKAEISLKVFFEEEIIHKEVEIGYFETGNSHTTKTLLINDKPFYKQNKTIKYSNYNTYESEKLLIHSIILPIRMQIILYKETEFLSKTIPFSNVKEEIIKKATQNVYNLVPNNAIVNSEKVNIKENVGTYTVSCCLETIITV